MKTLSTKILVVGVASAGLLFSACAAQTPATSTEEQAPGMTTEKQGDTTLTGKLTKTGDKYYIQAVGSPQQEVDSYSIDLSTFEGQTVSITGQFSGTTLFAGKVEVAAQ